MAPKHTYVKIDNPESEFHGETGFVYRIAGEETQDGELIPDGWCEIVFDPMATNGYHTELFRERNLAIEAC